MSPHASPQNDRKKSTPRVPPRSRLISNVSHPSQPIFGWLLCLLTTAGVAASAAQPKRGGGAQHDGGSAVGAALRLRRIHRHRSRMGQRKCLRTPPTRRRTRLRPWLRTEGRQRRRHRRRRHDGGARGDVHCGRRCAAAADDDADGDADNIVKLNLIYYYYSFIYPLSLSS